MCGLPVEFLNCVVVGAIYLVLISEGDHGVGHWPCVPGEYGSGLVSGLGGGREVGVRVVKGQVYLRDV